MKIAVLPLAFTDAIEHHHRVVDGIPSNREESNGKQAVNLKTRDQAEPGKDTTNNHDVVSQCHQSQKGKAPVVADCDVDSNSGESNQKRDQAAAQQLNAEAGTNRVNRLTSSDKGAGNGLQGLDHSLPLRCRQSWHTQNNRLPPIEKLNPGCVQIGSPSAWFNGERDGRQGVFDGANA